jgi:Family of unknown function (DUF5995)
MNASPADNNLLQVLSSRSPASIDEVIQLMEEIEDTLEEDDGLRWFNLLYLKVTEHVRDNPPLGAWQDPAWLARLDVAFANLYFVALASFLAGKPVPSSWQALFQARERAGVDRIQFALAGMNAHINHDLSYALLQLDDEMHKGFNEDSPEHQDYQHVNDLLEAVLPLALEFLATGILGQIAQDTDKIGKMLAVWNIRVARDLAWEFAEHLRSLPPFARAFATRSQDRFTGAIGRMLLLPIQP